MKKFLSGIAVMLFAGSSFIFAQDAVDALKISYYNDDQTNLLSLAKDGSTRTQITVSLDYKTSKKYFAGQFDLWLPKGVEVYSKNGVISTPGKLGDLKSKQIEDDFGDVTTVDPYTIGINYRNDPEAYNGDEGYFYRVLFYQGSALNDGDFFTFPDTSNELVRIQLVRTEEADDDVCPIYLKNVVLNTIEKEQVEIGGTPFIEYGIGESGYGTLCINDALDFTDATITANTVTSATDFASLAEVKKVPAATPLVINGKAGIYQLTPLSGDADAVGTNLLSGTPDAAFTATASTFALANKSKGVGFYRCKEGVEIPQYKAYMVNDAASADAFIFEGATGINDINAVEAEGDIYTISGVKVNKAQKGIYIQNGKKIVVK